MREAGVRLAAMRCCVVIVWGAGVTAARADAIDALGQDFWQWRASEQPFTGDDIPRIERPKGLLVDWSPATIAKRRADLRRFEQRWRDLAPAAEAPVQAQVDYRLLGAALARVRWELVILRSWQRDPGFYVDQTLGSVFILLLPPPPFSALRQDEILRRLDGIPATLEAARQNLVDLRRPFTALAIASLDEVVPRAARMATALAPQFAPAKRRRLAESTRKAAAALGAYREWLQSQLAHARDETAIGREGYMYFLRQVALLPYTPEQLLAMSREEWSRSVAFETYQQARVAGLPPAPLFPNADAQIEAERIDEQKIRDFLGQHGILTVPPWLQHYRNLLLPAYLAPFEDLGVTDDLTGPSRLDQNGTSYIRNPRPDLGFFYLSTARDPRPIVVHEGVPGHYFQLSLGWHNADPIRRHYYDSGANEGIGFYAEEMMLQAGLFDDNPRTRATLYSFMRLRALRVEVDVKLALGEFTLAQAAEYLERTVPMDAATAHDEAATFASTPGQAISYQVGKIQLTELLADVRVAQGAEFSLLRFNDFVWNNGNVPFALQRWELLHDASQVPAIDPAPEQP
jgi:uncharacterized protein (DUF885 family)